MSDCIKCGSKKAYWMVRDKENKAEYYCDPCFKKHDLADYKKEMDEYHKRKKEESFIAERRKTTSHISAISRPPAGASPYDNQIYAIAKNLINKHGDLVEVRCVSGNNPCRIELEFSDGEQLVVGEHSGRVDLSLMKAGYHGTGSKCFYTFLQTAGYSVTFDQIVSMKDGTILKK